VPLPEGKTVGPTTKLVFLGLEIDSVQQTVSVPQRKLVMIKAKVEDALKSPRVTLKELQSLIGSLSFICRAIAPGRAFLRRLIDLTCGARNAWAKINLSIGAIKDLQMWLVFLSDFNGISIIPEQVWSNGQELQLFTDACKTIGFGGYFRGKWFQGKWPPDVSKNHSIAWLEFFPILVAVVLWGKVLTGKRIILRSDNKSVIAIVNKQTSKCKEIMKLVRFFVLQCLKVQSIILRKTYTRYK
jgi:hypothetical protein